MITVKGKNYETEEEDWAFGDGVKAGIKAMCKKYGIDESDVYAKESSENTVNKNHSQHQSDTMELGKLQTSREGAIPSNADNSQSNEKTKKEVKR